MPTIKATDGTDLFVKDWGAGPSLLFVHSAAFDNEIWQYQHLHFLERGYRVVAYDARGHGRSDAVVHGFDFDTFADDLARVIEGVDLREVTLIGHSMGCSTIVRYLKNHGDERVARIALVGTTTPFLLKTEDNPGGVDGNLFEQTRDGWRRDFPRWISENARPFFVPESSQAIMDWAVGSMALGSATTAVLCNKMLTQTDFRDDCRSVSLPTLLIHGTRDASVPIDLTAKPTLELILGSQLKTYEGAPHGLMFTHMDRLHADLEAFIG